MGFLTAFLLGQVGLLLTEADPDNQRASVDEMDARRTVEAFYEGINTWIATGEGPLEAVLAPGFVDHTLSGAPDRNAPELFDYLSSLRTALPTLQFEVIEIEASGAIASVELLGVPGQLPAIDGWSIGLPAQQSFREVLRIERERVAERWGSDDLWPKDAIEFEHELPPQAEAPRQPAIQKFTLDPVSEYELFVTGPVWILVESGALEVELSGWDESGTLRLPAEPISQGGARMVEPDGELHVRPLGQERVVLWTVSLDLILTPGNSMGNLAIDLPTDIRQDARVSLGVRLPKQEIRFSVRVITVPAETLLSMSAASLHAIAVVAGELQAQPKTGEIFYCFDGSRSRLLTGPQTALPEQGFANQRGSSATYQVAGPDPATLILLSIVPADSSLGHPIRTGPG